MFLQELPPIDPISTVVDIIVGVGGLLASLFGGGGGSVKQLNDAVRHVEEQVLSGLKTIGLGLQLAFGAGIIGFLKRLWDALGKLAKLIHDALAKIQKIVAYIRRIHDYLFNRFIGPLLNAIQHLRQVLTIFRIFHVKFAAKLDATLANIEYKIASRFEYVWQQMNQLISWAQLITGLDGLFNPAVLWGSLTRDLAILRGLTGLGPATPLLPGDEASQALDRELFSAGTVAGRQAQWSQSKLPDAFATRLSGIRSSVAQIDKAV
jgi:hypothetical protein